MLGTSCTISSTGEVTCGTGGWVGPRPGDPSTSDVYITATPAFGGIDVNWTYPQINPEAVAYTIVYRSLLPDPESATVLVHANGTFYYDRIDDPTKPTYYYWIRVVSVYGTVSDMLGPAWAQAKPLIEEMIELLTGQIDAGVLAQSLKAEIDQITLNKLGITAEMLARAQNDDALGVRLTEVSAYTGTTRALLLEEVVARTSQGEAFVSTVNTLYAELNGNVSAVQTQITALTTEVNSLAQQITQVESDFGDDLAQVQQTMQTNIDTVNGRVTAIGALWTAQVNVNGLIGGFGVYNNGQIVEAGFDVDRFWVGRTGTNKRKPFIIENETVYIDEAAINHLVFSKLRDESGSFIVENGKIKADYLQVNQLVVNHAQSDNFVNNSTGWAFLPDGTVQINGNVAGQGRMLIDNSGITFFYASGRVASKMGINV